MALGNLDDDLINSPPVLSLPLVQIVNQSEDSFVGRSDPGILTWLDEDEKIIWSAKNQPWNCLLDVTHLSRIALADITDKELLNRIEFATANLPFDPEIVVGFPKVLELRRILRDKYNHSKPSEM